MTQAFFSYSRIDWEAPADGADVRALADGLQPQVHAELGERSFILWRDDQLRWGDAWRRKLQGVMRSSDFMIVLLSMAWLRSDVCGWEYDVFRDHTEENELEDRILPISLRAIASEDLATLEPEQQLRYDALRAIQQANWRDLPQLDDRNLNRLLDKTAKALKASVRTLPAKAVPPTVVSATPEASADAVPVDGHIIPPVSGDYYIPSQARDTVQLNLAVAGLASVETDEGTVIFAIRAMTVQTNLTGGRIMNGNADFATGWDGPIATVTRIQSGIRQTALQIEARDRYLQGEPLAGKGESGHVHLFDIEPEDGATIEVSGTVSIQRQAIRIEDDKCDLDPEQAEARDTMIARLTKILLKDHIDPMKTLEGAQDDRSDTA